MRQSPLRERRLRELIDSDLPAHELERLARVDALLRQSSAEAGRSRECERTRASISAALDHELSESESIRMREHVERCAPCRAFQVEAETVATALRSARTGEEAARPCLRLVATPPPAAESTRHKTDKETHELKLTFAELVLIYKSLQAAKTLGVLPPQNELLDDTIQLVDQALQGALR